MGDLTARARRANSRTDLAFGARKKLSAQSCENARNKPRPASPSGWLPRAANWLSSRAFVNRVSVTIRRIDDRSRRAALAQRRQNHACRDGPGNRRVRSESSTRSERAKPRDGCVCVRGLRGGSRRELGPAFLRRNGQACLSRIYGRDLSQLLQATLRRKSRRHGRAVCPSWFAPFRDHRFRLKRRGACPTRNTAVSKRTSGANMAEVYVEACPKGNREGTPITNFVVEDHAGSALGAFKTKREAIDWAKSEGHSPLVARVRHVNDRKSPDNWQSA